jgi:hypothetical protein
MHGGFLGPLQSRIVSFFHFMGRGGFRAGLGRGTGEPEEDPEDDAPHGVLQHDAEAGAGQDHPAGAPPRKRAVAPSRPARAAFAAVRVRAIINPTSTRKSASPRIPVRPSTANTLLCGLRTPDPARPLRRLVLRPEQGRGHAWAAFLAHRAESAARADRSVGVRDCPDHGAGRRGARPGPAAGGARADPVGDSAWNVTGPVAVGRRKVELSQSFPTIMSS